MPIQKRDIEGDTPDEPHFALLMGQDGGRLAIRPGSSLWVVEDASNQNKIFPLTLKRVSHDQIVFEMADGKGGLTEYRYKLTTAKPLNRQALIRLRSNNPDAKAQK